MEEKKKPFNWLALFIASIIVIIISSAVLICSHVVRKQRREKLEGYFNYLYNYFDTNFPERYYVDSSDTVVMVHVWEPGTALALTVNRPLNEPKIKDKYGKLAGELWESLKKSGLSDYYGISLLLHNDQNTEKILMWWVDGRYQEGE